MYVSYIFYLIKLSQDIVFMQNNLGGTVNLSKLITNYLVV